MTSTATTIRYSSTYGCRMIRVWDVYAQQWRLYSLDERVPARILASLPDAERRRIKRAQGAQKKLNAEERRRVRELCQDMAWVLAFESAARTS